MLHPTIEFREERDLGQKINATFGFIKHNFKPLLICTLYFVLPLAMLTGIFSGIYQSHQIAEANNAVQYESVGDFYFGSMLSSFHYWLSIFFMLMSYVMLSLTVYAYIVLYMDYGGAVEVRDVWAYIKSYFIPVLYSSVGVGVLCGAATLFLVLPGIYVGVALSMFFMVMVREELGFLDALERCFYLIKGNWWETFGFLLVVGVIQAVLNFGVALPAYVVYILRIFHLPGGQNDLVMVAATSFSTIVSLLMYVISVTAIAFQYFNLVEVKDGVGFLEQVDQIGASSPWQGGVPEDQF